MYTMRASKHDTPQQNGKIDLIWGKFNRNEPTLCRVFRTTELILPTANNARRSLVTSNGPGHPLLGLVAPVRPRRLHVRRPLLRGEQEARGQEHVVGRRVPALHRELLHHILGVVQQRAAVLGLLGHGGARVDHEGYRQPGVLLLRHGVFGVLFCSPGGRGRGRGRESTPQLEVVSLLGKKESRFFPLPVARIHMRTSKRGDDCNT